MKKSTAFPLCKYLASVLAGYLGHDRVLYNEKVVPTCVQASSGRLHKLSDTGYVVMKDRGHVDAFHDHLERSGFFVMDFHGVDNPL